MARPIAAILALDVAGDSSLMESDAQRALGDLNRVRRTVVRPTIERNGGRVVKVMPARGPAWPVVRREIESFLEGLAC